MRASDRSISLEAASSSTHFVEGASERARRLCCLGTAQPPSLLLLLPPLAQPGEDGGDGDDWVERASERASVRRPSVSLRLFAVAARKRGSIDADEMKGETGREERARVTRG